ncbi:acyl-CoA dehydrogenase [Albimonas sp. CAU 1670]|uniref:acyl-CoA dehydrogenase family protein n=1 Tax=Albimonas sp. CAU 1670 TaxID=3032599 RepID=UPI0023DA69FE|nr:acyl-CoA dehydrogenase [Albimonas sp. CAU 1670]MDF2233938.1 acyl-CoA dehydrogenase [Albimonas sp. CAU 1670]
MTAFSTEERQLLSESAEAWFKDRYGPEHSKKLTRETEDGFGREEWKTYAEMGWLGLAMPEDAGGSDGGLTELSILLATAGKHLAVEPLLPTLVLGAGALAQMGTPAQQETLGKIAEGACLMAFLHAEPASGFARDHVEAVASRSGEGFSLTGAKTFAIGAHAADLLVVSARIGDASGPVGLFLVPGKAEGVSLNASPAMDGRKGAAATFEGVSLGADALLGGAETDRLAAIDALLDRGTLAACAEAVGAMHAATATTLDYLKQRKQFGRALSEFQVIQHRLVDMNILCEETRAAVHSALTAVDEGRADAHLAVWRAKVQCARASRFIGGQAVQLHGGMGMTDELAASHFYKRLSVTEAQFGDGEWHLRRLIAAGATAPASAALAAGMAAG